MNILKPFFLFLLFYSFLGIGKETVCLNMIVKDEAAVITRCLTSVLPLIDCWVIVDTGSTDGTQDVIRNFFREKNIPGELYERPWVNFGYNRNEALQLAKSQADYLLFMDADDKLALEEGFTLPKLTESFYTIPTRTGTDYTWLVRLVRSDQNWFWEGAIHEDLRCSSSTSGRALEGATYVYLHDGARAKDPHTPQKDIQLLLNAIQKEPSNPHNFFYLGKMYLSLGELEKALQTFKQCAEMKGFEEEIYLSKLSVAQVQNMLKKDPLTVKKSFLDAFSYRPHRAEALYGLIDKLQEEKEYEKAFQAVSLALELPRQHNDILFVEHWILDFGFLIQYAMCAAQTGRYVEGLQACKTLLAERNLSEDQKSQVNKYQGYLQELSQKELKQKLQNLISPALL